MRFCLSSTPRSSSASAHGAGVLQRKLYGPVGIILVIIVITIINLVTIITIINVVTIITIGFGVWAFCGLLRVEGFGSSSGLGFRVSFGFRVLGLVRIYGFGF